LFESDIDRGEITGNGGARAGENKICGSIPSQDQRAVDHQSGVFHVVSTEFAEHFELAMGRH
jgi:hypothetical protein